MLKISPFGLELWEKKHLAPPHYDQNRHFSQDQQLQPPLLSSVQRNNRLARIGGVKLAGLGMVSFESSDRCCGGAPYTRGRLKLSSGRANSPTALSLLRASILLRLIVYYYFGVRTVPTVPPSTRVSTRGYSS